MSRYLNRLPESGRLARKLYTYALNNFSNINRESYYSFDDILAHPQKVVDYLSTIFTPTP